MDTASTIALWVLIAILLVFNAYLLYSYLQQYHQNRSKSYPRSRRIHASDIDNPFPQGPIVLTTQPPIRTANPISQPRRPSTDNSSRRNRYYSPTRSMDVLLNGGFVSEPFGVRPEDIEAQVGLTGRAEDRTRWVSYEQMQWCDPSRKCKSSILSSEAPEHVEKERQEALAVLNTPRKGSESTKAASETSEERRRKRYAVYGELVWRPVTCRGITDLRHNPSQAPPIEYQTLLGQGRTLPTLS